MTVCPACDNTKIRALPIGDGVEAFPCPCCVPWVHGFPGEKVGNRFIIEPSEPEQPAKWLGFPTV